MSGPTNRKQTDTRTHPSPSPVPIDVAAVNERPALLACADALRVSTAFLETEARCHEESHDLQRQSYVEHLRAQAAVNRSVLAALDAEQGA